TAPVNAYGRSKLAGEDAVRAAGGTYAVLRTSWVVSAHGNNFVKTMLRLGKERERLTIVADQIGAPTPARGIAAACLEIARQLIEDPGKSGTYHFAGAPQTSWAGFARGIFARAGIACDVEDIPAAEYPAPAARPLNSRLDCSAIDTVFGIPQPDWRTGLDEILKDLGEVS
ncbi:MAG: sugar nucleotide-binding protein, partial [Rhodobacteraceae bacterium]|nr:sugar nucleotide-binding protein [Paracoccaceae bacterium]